jgi:hypothetical protein
MKPFGRGRTLRNKMRYTWGRGASELNRRPTLPPQQLQNIADQHRRAHNRPRLRSAL